MSIAWYRTVAVICCCEDHHVIGHIVRCWASMMRVVNSCETKSASLYGPNYSHLCVTFVKDWRILLLFSIITCCVLLIVTLFTVLLVLSWHGYLYYRGMHYKPDQWRNCAKYQLWKWWIQAACIFLRIICEILSRLFLIWTDSSKLTDWQCF